MGASDAQEQGRGEAVPAPGWPREQHGRSPFSVAAWAAGPVAASASAAGGPGTSSRGLDCSVGAAVVSGALRSGCGLGVFISSRPFPGLCLWWSGSESVSCTVSFQDISFLGYSAYRLRSSALLHNEMRGPEGQKRREGSLETGEARRWWES